VTGEVPVRAAALQRPEVPAHFRALRVLGEGSTAVTWLAHHEVTGQDVALKVWRSPLRDPAGRQRFVNECRWHRLLDGERGIVGWIWASEPDLEHPWTATQPHGLTLTEYLRRYQVTPAQAVRLSLDILDGLCAVHRRGLVHRDINPNNVLVDDSGAALCDFGLAMPVDGVTMDRAAGTPGFVAPELDAEVPGFRSDVYSAAQTIARLLGSDVPAAVDHLVTAVAGSTRPADRPADAMEFAARFRTVVNETLRLETSAAEPVTLSVPGSADDVTTTRRRRRARRWMPWVAVLAVLLTAGVLLRPQLSGRHGASETRTASSLAASAASSSAASAELPSAPVTPTGADTASPGGVSATPRAAAVPSARASGGEPGPPVTHAPASALSSPRPAASASPAGMSGTPGAAAAGSWQADIGPNGEPVLGPVRQAGRCDGAVRSATELKGAGGIVVGTVKVYEDSGTTLCAKFVKAQGPLWNVRTYLALTMCNPQGTCDSDWNYYLQDAGPVRVNAPGGCLRWRVSATDVNGTTWLLRDRTGSTGC
jgi:hypothetical protein